MDTAEFLDSNDENVLRVKQCIFYSARLATHLAIEMYLMGELDMPVDHKELLVSPKLRNCFKYFNNLLLFVELNSS